jgi:hypothetical protein
VLEKISSYDEALRLLFRLSVVSVSLSHVVSGVDHGPQKISLITTQPKGFAVAFYNCLYRRSPFFTGASLFDSSSTVATSR